MYRHMEKRASLEKLAYLLTKIAVDLERRGLLAGLPFMLALAPKAAEQAGRTACREALEAVEKSLGVAAEKDEGFGKAVAAVTEANQHANMVESVGERLPAVARGLETAQDILYRGGMTPTYMACRMAPVIKGVKKAAEGYEKGKELVRAVKDVTGNMVDEGAVMSRRSFLKGLASGLLKPSVERQAGKAKFSVESTLGNVLDGSSSMDVGNFLLKFLHGNDVSFLRLCKLNNLLSKIPLMYV